MSDFITLSCPSCGGRLEITKDMDRFVCAHCGNEHVVRRAGGTISLAPVMEGLQKVQASTDRVGAELAIQRLTREMQEAQTKIRQAQDNLLRAKQAENRFTPVSLWTIAAVGSTLGLCLFGVLVAAGAGSAEILALAVGCLLVALISWAITISHFRWHGKLKRLSAQAAVDLKQANAYHDTLSQKRDQATTAIAPPAR